MILISTLKQATAIKYKINEHLVYDERQVGYLRLSSI